MPTSPGELGTHDCITFEGLLSPRAWTFAKGKSDVSVAIHSRLIVNTAEAAIDAAIAGVGVTRVLSYQIANAIRAGTLAIALQEFEPAPGRSVLSMPVRALATEVARLPRFRGTAVEGEVVAGRSSSPRPATPSAFLVPGTRQAD